jgi:hypothetical protein
MPAPDVGEHGPTHRPAQAVRLWELRWRRTTLKVRDKEVETMTATVKHTAKANEWAEVTRALEVVRKDLRRDVKKLESAATIDREKLEKSLRGIVDILDQGFAAASKTVRDPQLRRDIAGVGKAIRTALRKTAPRRMHKPAKPVNLKPTAKTAGPKAAMGTRPTKRQTRKV